MMLRDSGLPLRVSICHLLSLTDTVRDRRWASMCLFVYLSQTHRYITYYMTDIIINAMVFSIHIFLNTLTSRDHYRPSSGAWWVRTRMEQNVSPPSERQVWTGTNRVTDRQNRHLMRQWLNTWRTLGDWDRSRCSVTSSPSSASSPSPRHGGQDCGSDLWLSLNTETTWLHKNIVGLTCRRLSPAAGPVWMLDAAVQQGALSYRQTHHRK